MRRALLTVSAILVTFCVPAAWANVYDDATAEARNAQSQSNTNGAAVSLLNVNSGSGTNSTSSNNANAPTTLFRNDVSTQATTGAASNTYQLPSGSAPWGWSWFPYYQCALSFWKTSSESGVALSPLEKFDTYCVNRGTSTAYAAAFEASDTRPWISDARGLPRGHNLALAVQQAGSYSIPWKVGSTFQTVDCSWWGHCNGWAAAAVSFPESQLTDRQISLSQRKIRCLKRPLLNSATANLGSSSYSGGIAALYQEQQATSMNLYGADLKSILTEYGMQLRPAAAFTSGRRYDAPVTDVEEYYFKRRSDGTIIIPTDAQMMWVALYMDGKNQGGWQIQKGVSEQALKNWRVQVEQYYRHYYPNRQIYTTCIVRYTNLPLNPTAAQLADLPPLVRDTFLDSYPLDVHDKAVACFSGSGGKAHGLIAEVIPGSQVWNYPVTQYSYTMTAMTETAFNLQATFAAGNVSNPSALFNLLNLDRNKLTNRNGQYILRYRVGTMNMTLQKLGSSETNRYDFIVFYGTTNTAMGSSWVGASVTSHPDFVWYPDLDNPADPNTGNPYVRAADLKALLPNLQIR